MLPYDLKKSGSLQIDVNAKIVVITSKKMRHRRFALKMQQKFGDRVALWIEVGNEVSVGRKNKQRIGKKERLKNLLKLLIRPASLISLIYALRFTRLYKKGDSRIFRREVSFLESFKRIEPIRISAAELYSEDLFEKIKALGPAVLCTLGGPLYKKSLLNLFVACVNQHAGHSPEFKGVNTTDWALFHRNLNLLGSTVHLTDTGADSGQILRRSLTCVFPGDDPALLFYKTVALGTDMMLEVLEDLFSGKDVPLFKQPESYGKTYLGKDLTDFIKSSVQMDYQLGKIDEELKAIKTF